MANLIQGKKKRIQENKEKCNNKLASTPYSLDISLFENPG